MKTLLDDWVAEVVGIPYRASRHVGVIVNVQEAGTSAPAAGLGELCWTAVPLTFKGEEMTGSCPFPAMKL